MSKKYIGDLNNEIDKQLKNYLREKQILLNKFKYLFQSIIKFE